MRRQFRPCHSLPEPRNRVYTISDMSVLRGVLDPTNLTFEILESAISIGDRRFQNLKCEVCGIKHPAENRHIRDGVHSVSGLREGMTWAKLSPHLARFMRRS